MTLTNGPLNKVVKSKGKFTSAAPKPYKPPATPAVPGLGNSDPNNPLAWNTQLVAVGDLNHQAIGGKSIRDQVPPDQLPTFDQTQADVQQRISDAIQRVKIPNDVSGSTQLFEPTPTKKGKPVKSKKTTKKSGSGGSGGSGGGSGSDGGSGYDGSTASDASYQSSGAFSPDQIAALFHALNEQAPMDQLRRTAALMAGNEVNQAVGPYQSQKREAVREASNRAAAVMAAYRALANMTEGDTHDLQNAYQQAGQNIAAAAQGFTGQTGAIASKDAAALNNDLAHLPGARGVTGTSGFNLLTAPAGGQNALYGINGKAPADAFFQDAADAYKAAQLAPRGIMQQGIDAMQVAQHASDSREQTINNLINQAKAKLPGLTQTALTNLVSNWNTMHNSQLKSLSLALQFDKDTRAANQGDAKITETANKDAFNTWLQQVKQHDTEDYHTGLLRNAGIRNAISRYRALHADDPKPPKPLTPKDIWGAVERAAIGTWAKGGAANNDQAVQQFSAMSDPGGALNYIMTHTGMTQAQAMAALQSYSGERARLYALKHEDQYAPYNWDAYLAALQRHAGGGAGGDIRQRLFGG